MQWSLFLLFIQLWMNVDICLSQAACLQVPDVPHGHVSAETQKPDYQQGDVIHFACETGYISGPTIRYVCTNSGWSALRKGKCYLKPCVLPDDIPHGQYRIIHGDDFVFGTTIQYFCNEGYHMISKYDTRTCLLEGWTNHPPVCERLTCDPPPADSGVTVKGLSENDDPIHPDHFLRFSCEAPGKYLNGSAVVNCGKDGQWDKPFPSCEDITCEVGLMNPHLKAAGLTPLNKTVKTGHKLQFHCEKFTLEGPQEVRCLETGQWNSAFPTCSDGCKIPEDLSSVHHSSRRRKARAGQKLKFQCRNRQHVLQGEAEVECLVSGQWSSPFPTCSVPKGCGRPPHLPDGDTKISVKYNYDHNEVVEYICQNYYTMQGEPRRVCRNGEWIGEMKCLKPCTVDRNMMETHNIQFAHRRDDKLYSAHDDVIEFMCKRGRHDGTVEFRQKCINGVILLPTCS